MGKQRTVCDEVIVQIVVRTYDEYNRPIGDAITQPVKIFRAQAPDFWKHVDRAVAENAQQLGLMGLKRAPARAGASRARGRPGASE